MSIIDSIKNMKLWIFLLIIAVIGFILLYLQFNPTLHEGGDNCKYMSIARSVAQGNGFRQIWDPEMPKDYKWSPGYIVLLSGIILITGNVKPILAFKIMSMVFYLLSLVLTAYIFNKHLEFKKWATLGIVFLIAINTSLSHLSSIVLTESTFLFFMLLTLWFLMIFENKNNWLWLAVITLVSVAAVYVRVPMLFLGVAIFVWMLFSKRFLKSVVYIICYFLLLSPRLIPMFTLGKGEGYMEHMPSGTFIQKIQEALLHTIDTLKYQLFAKLPQFIAPFKTSFFEKINVLGILIAVILLAVFIIGIIYAWRINSRSRLMVIIPVLLTASFMPVAPPRLRYISLLSPFFLYTWMLGATWLFNRFKIKKIAQNSSWIIIFVVLVTCLSPSFVKDVRTMHIARKYFRAIEGGIDTVLPYRLSQKISEYHKVLHYCRLYLPQDAILISSRPHISFIVSDLKGVRDDWSYKNPMDSGIMDEDSLLVYLIDKGATNIIVEEIYYYSMYHLMPSLQKYKDCYEVLYASQIYYMGVLDIDKDCIFEEMAGESEY